MSVDQRLSTCLRSAIRSSTFWMPTEKGPLNVPESPQSRPVYIQAGQSDAGRGFAARWAEAIFTAHMTKDSAKAFYTDVKSRAVGCGRSPDDIVVLPGISAAIGSTTREGDAGRAGPLPCSGRA